MAEKFSKQTIILEESRNLDVRILKFQFCPNTSFA